jgi:hypothetical protein
MFVLYFGTQNAWFGANPVGRTGNYNEPLIVPQPYAFAIWGIIYLGITALPIYQWFNRREGHQLWFSFRAWFSLNVIFNGLWLVAASYDWLWISVGIIVFMLVSLYNMRAILAKLEAAQVSINYWLEALVIHMYMAWITLATVLNVSAALSMYEWQGFGQTELFWSLLILTIAAFIGWLVFNKYRDRAFAGVIVWAFVALIVKHLEPFPPIAYLSIGVVVLFGMLMVLPRQRLA